MTTTVVLTGIRERRMAAGLSRQALAERCRCSISYIAQIESGLRPSTSDVLPRVEATLDGLERVQEPEDDTTPRPA
jgi:transcriptional regulator with XRE-family HTH domain